jgi:large subunit ribosomal protein L35
VPKIKTHKSTAKRFRRTGTGKLVRMYQGRGHLRRNKSARTLVRYRQIETVENAAAEKRITRLAPYLD